MDRQDIDALLIGALYGELTPADEARLAAHLESHPTDRGALDDLKLARAAVRESRIFDQQVEPPQAVSALLLQEAHRRAPKRAPADDEGNTSWFYRFTRVFLVHPAMAAAAMLVLVVGVAGTLYMRNGARFADKEAPALSAAPERAGNEMASAPAAEPSADRGLAEGAVSAGSGYSVQLDDNAQTVVPNADKRAESRARAEQEPTAKRKGRADEPRKTSSGMVVTTPERQPKDLDSFDSGNRTRAAKPERKLEQGRFSAAETTTLGADTGVVGGAAPGTATPPRAPARNAPAQASPSPPPPTAVAGAPATPRPSPAKEAAPAPAEEKADAADSALIAWARREHNRTVALASKGDCRAAAKIAISVQSRAPDYYAQVMATDRLLKKCQVYIAQERDAEAERAGKLRSKRVTSDEAADSK